MSEQNPFPEKATLEIFEALIKIARRNAELPIGNLVKHSLSTYVRAKYHSTTQSNSIPAIWHRFLVDIRKAFPSIVDVKFTEVSRSRQHEDIYADIKSLILDKWQTKETLQHERIAYAAYLLSHTSFRSEFISAARGIDIVVIGATFEEKFARPMPFSAIEADQLLKEHQARELSVSTHSVAANLPDWENEARHAGKNLKPGPYAHRLERFVEEHLSSPDEKLQIPFGGRTEEFRALDEWLNNEDAPARLLLTAPAGRGKSALLVRWIKRLQGELRSGLLVKKSWNVVLVPISVRHRTADFEIFMRILETELLKVAQSDPKYLNQERAQDIEVRCTNLLAEIATKGIRTLIVMDGADEAFGGSFTAEWFPNATNRVLKVIVSARSIGKGIDEERWLEKIRWRRGNVHTLFLDTLSVSGVNEVMDSVQIKREESQSLAHELLRLTKGEPLLLRYYVQDIETNQRETGLQIDNLALNRMKPGFSEYFRRWFDDQEAIWQANRSPFDRNIATGILGILAWAQGPLSARDIIQIGVHCGMNLERGKLESYFGQISRFVLESARREDWPLRSKVVYYLAHSQINVFLREEYVGLGVDTASTIQSAYKSWATETLRKLHNREIEPADVSTYLSKHIIGHLDKAHDTEHTLAKLADPRWLRTCIEASTAQSFLNTCEVACSLALKRGPSAWRDGLKLSVSASVVRSGSFYRMPPPELLSGAIHRGWVSSHALASFAWAHDREYPHTEQYAAALANWLFAEVVDRKFEYIEDCLQNAPQQFVVKFIDAVLSNVNRSSLDQPIVWDWLWNMATANTMPEVRLKILCAIVVNSGDRSTKEQRQLMLQAVCEISSEHDRVDALKSLLDIPDATLKRSLYSSVNFFQNSSRRVEAESLFVETNRKAVTAVVGYLLRIKPEQYGHAEIALLKRLGLSLGLHPDLVSLVHVAMRKSSSILEATFIRILSPFLNTNGVERMTEEILNISDEFYRIYAIFALAMEHKTVLPKALETLSKRKTWSARHSEMEVGVVSRYISPSQILEPIIFDLNLDQIRFLESCVNQWRDESTRSWGKLLLAKRDANFTPQAIKAIASLPSDLASRMLDELTAFIEPVFHSSAIDCALQLDTALDRAHALLKMIALAESRREQILAVLQQEWFEHQDLMILQKLSPHLSSEMVADFLEEMERNSISKKAEALEVLCSSHPEVAIGTFQGDHQNVDLAKFSRYLKDSDISIALGIATEMKDEHTKFRVLCSLSSRSSKAELAALRHFELAQVVEPYIANIGVFDALEACSSEKLAALFVSLIPVVPPDALQHIDSILAKSAKSWFARDAIVLLLKRQPDSCCAALKMLEHASYIANIAGAIEQIDLIIKLLPSEQLDKVQSIALGKPSLNDRAAILLPLARRYPPAVLPALELGKSLELDHQLRQRFLSFLAHTLERSTSVVSEEFLLSLSLRGDEYLYLVDQWPSAVDFLLSYVEANDTSFITDTFVELIPRLSDVQLLRARETAITRESPECRAVALSVLSAAFSDVIDLAVAAIRDVNHTNRVHSSRARAEMRGLRYARVEALELILPNVSPCQERILYEDALEIRNPVVRALSLWVLHRHHGENAQSLITAVRDLAKTSESAAAWLIELCVPILNTDGVVELGCISLELKDCFNRSEALIACTAKDVRLSPALMESIRCVLSSEPSSWDWASYERALLRDDPKEAALRFLGKCPRSMSTLVAFEALDLLLDSFNLYRIGPCLRGLVEAHPAVTLKVLGALPVCNGSLDALSHFIPVVQGSYLLDVLELLAKCTELRGLDQGEVFGRVNSLARGYKLSVERAFSLEADFPRRNEVIHDVLSQALSWAATQKLDSITDLVFGGVLVQSARLGREVFQEFWDELSSVPVRSLRKQGCEQ